MVAIRCRCVRNTSISCSSISRPRSGRQSTSKLLSLFGPFALLASDLPSHMHNITIFQWTLLFTSIQSGFVRKIELDENEIQFSDVRAGSPNSRWGLPATEWGRKREWRTMDNGKGAGNESALGKCLLMLSWWLLLFFSRNKIQTIRFVCAAYRQRTSQCQAKQFFTLSSKPSPRLGDGE